MVQSGCQNGELDTTNYSAPMLVIGVYIAFSCLVCFFSMVFDIYYSIRRRKLCLPSKFFTPNSFTLTVISVAIKLPVDLNTAMPRAVDQLSKLTSTCFLFISLGLFMTSLGTTKMSESIENMAALTVLVVTVVVNMGIQMFTGVVFAFTIEHLVVLSCTLILLALLWSSTLSIDFLKDVWADVVDDTNPSEWTIQRMEQQIKELCVASYSMNPQLFMCGTPICSSIGVLCAIVSLVLLEAIVSFIFLEAGISTSAIKDRRFCEGESDYKWSIWCVVVTQTITIVLGSFTLVVRWLLPLGHMSLSKPWKDFYMEDGIGPMWTFGLRKQMILPLPCELKNKCLMSIFGVIKNSIIALLIVVQMSMVLASDLVVFLCLELRKACKWVVSLCWKDGGPKESNSNSNEDWAVSPYVVAYPRDDDLREWLKKGSINNMEGWVRESKNDDLTHLIKHLSNFSPPQSAQSSLLHHIFNNTTSDDDDYNVSCLSILVLAKYASILVPSPLSDSLIERVKEAFELIYFIDKKMNTRSMQNKLRWILAKGMWLNMGISNNYLEKKIIAPICNEGSQKKKGIDRFWLIVKAFTNSNPAFQGELSIYLLRLEFKVIGGCFLNRSDASVVELRRCIETMIGELLHLFLKYLPTALHKEYSEISHEDSEERMRRALKYFCKLKILKDEVLWEWPNEALLKKEKKNYVYPGKTRRGKSFLPLLASPNETLIRKKKKKHLYSGETSKVEGSVVSGKEHVVAIDPSDSNVTPISNGEIIEEMGGG